MQRTNLSSVIAVLSALCLLVNSCCDDDNCGACEECLCGNGQIDQGEDCDGTNFGGLTCEDFGLDPGYPICQSDCTVTCTSCGNGLVEVTPDGYGEECDDGNNNDGDGCSADCLLETCGNSIMDPGEVCDDGNNDFGDGCSPDCMSDETCGNGIVDTTVGEVCDDGNTTSGDGCSSLCQLEFCGNNIMDPGEVCDDGNNSFGDGCTPDCMSDETCGNAYVDWAVGEECDDGNLFDGDGCSAMCTVE